MTLSNNVKESLEEATGHLRNALAFAARNEKPAVCNQIAEVILKIDQMEAVDDILEHLEDFKNSLGDED